MGRRQRPEGRASRRCQRQEGAEADEKGGETPKKGQVRTEISIPPNRVLRQSEPVRRKRNVVIRTEDMAEIHDYFIVIS